MEHSEMSIADYLAVEAESSGKVRSVLECCEGYPARYHFDMPASSKMNKGSAVHCALLEPERFAAEYGVYPGKVRRGKEYDAWLVEIGKTALLASEFGDIEQIQLSLERKPKIKQFFATAEMVEHSYFWTDTETGLACKCRPDLITKHGIKLDIKTTDGKITERSFSRTCVEMGYYIQDAFYTMGVQEAMGTKINTSGCLMVQSKPPYEMTVYLYDELYKRMGERQAREGLRIIAECKKSGVWPGMPEIQDVTPPAWME